MVPDKPIWYGRLDQVIAELDNLPWPWVDRETLQSLLQVGPRRAQQILRPCVTRQVGANGVAGREELIAHLRRLGTGDEAQDERRGRTSSAEVTGGSAHHRAQSGIRQSAGWRCGIARSHFHNLFFAQRGAAETSRSRHGDWQRFQ